MSRICPSSKPLSPKTLRQSSRGSASSPRESISAARWSRSSAWTEDLDHRAAEIDSRGDDAGVNFGRSMVEVVGVDRSGTPTLVALGFTGDDAMLFRVVEAYAWTLEYPESVRRLVP